MPAEPLRGSLQVLRVHQLVLLGSDPGAIQPSGNGRRLLGMGVARGWGALWWLLSLLTPRPLGRLSGSFCQAASPTPGKG